MFAVAEGRAVVVPPVPPAITARSKGPVALNRDPVARAGMRPVIPHRMMLYAAIVPERDRVFLPAKPALEQRVRHVLVEILQNAGALVARYAVDVAGESLVDIECLAAGHGVGADHRMVGKGVALLVLDPVIGVLAAIMLAVMAGGKTLEIGLHPIG